MSLKKILKGLKSESRPDKKCKKALWRQLEHKYDHMYPADRRFVSKPAVIIAAAVLFAVSVGTSAYAYDSPEVVEGHPLHFLKENIENFEGKLKFSSEKKAEWHIKMQNRRMEEGQYFMEKNDFRKKIFENGIKEIPFSLDEAKKIPTKENRQKMFEFISHSEEDQIETLIKIKPMLSKYSQEVVDRMIAEHTKNIQEIIRTLENSEQVEFTPLSRRRFMILRPGELIPVEISSSSDSIVTVDGLPDEFSNMRVIFLNQ